jgi:hypothetical protein
VPQDNDFELLELSGLSAERHESDEPAHQHVAYQREHEASYIARTGGANSTQTPSRFVGCSVSLAGSQFLHPSGRDPPGSCGLQLASRRISRNSFVRAAAATEGSVRPLAPPRDRHRQF